jgi:hypothetical protein
VVFFNLNLRLPFLLCWNVLWAQCLRVAPPIAVFVSLTCVAKLNRCWPLKVLTRKTSM